MSYEIHLSIPEESSGGHLIATLTAEQHITPSQAVAKIIDQAGRQQAPEPVQDQDVKTIVAEALRKVEQVRPQRAQELASLSGRNESAAQLIGFLNDDPEIVEAIRESSREHRATRYGR